MKKTNLLILITLMFLCTGFNLAHASKYTSHLITLPILEGCGGFSSIYSLIRGDGALVKSAGVANLSLLAVNAMLGGMKMYIVDDEEEKLRTVHRIFGFITVGASVWLAVSISLDSGTARTAGAVVSYIYSPATLIPIFTFKF